MTQIPKSWSNEDKVHVAKMIVEGLSFAKIGEAFSVSKNAVIGVVKRTPELKALNRIREQNKPAPLGRAEVRRRAAERSRQQRATKSKAKTAGVVVESEKPKAPAVFKLPIKREAELQTVGRPLAELSAFECRWAVNDADMGQEYLFCGDRITESSRYCAHHKAKAFGLGTPSERAALNILKKHAA